MIKSQYVISPGTKYVGGTHSDELQLVWDQVTTCLKENTWKAIYAESDAEYDKIVADMESAYDKVRNYTSPINAMRFCDATPCSKTGMCGDCLSPQSICAQFVETRICKPDGRIKVILVGEDLGI